MYSPSILIVSLKYSPVHNTHCRALGEPLRALGYNIRYLLAHSYKWMVPETQLRYTSFIGTSRSAREVIWDTLALVSWRRQLLYALLSEIRPSLILFESSHPANIIVVSAARSVQPETKCWMLLHEPYVREKLRHEYVQSMLITAHELSLKLIMNRLDGVLLPSEEAMRQFKQRYSYFKGAVVKVPLLFEDRSKARNCKRTYYSFIGHAVRAKGIDRFFQLIETAASAGADWQFQIVTSTDISAYLAHLSHAARSRLHIVNKPQLSDDEIDEAISKSWAVLAPYRRVTQSGVVPVAFMHGTPVISTNVGGMSEWVIHGKTGYLLSLDASFSEWENAFYFVQSNFAYLSANCRRFFLENFDARHSPEFLRPMLDSIGASS